MPSNGERNSWIWKISRDELSIAVKASTTLSELSNLIGVKRGNSRTLKAKLDFEDIDWNHIKPTVPISRNWRNLPKPVNKVCTKCNSILPFNDEFFSPHKRAPWGLRQQCRKCSNATALPINKKLMQKIRLEVLSHYGINGNPICQCCGETRLEFLSLDHIEGNGRKDRARHGSGQQLFRHLIRDGFPLGYRTLCHNCNMSFGLYGYCPHEKEYACAAV